MDAHFLKRLERWGLLRPPDALPEDLSPERVLTAPTCLEAYCERGLLVGGLSAALSVRADELLGPLAMQMGGPASRLKVQDVRDERHGSMTLIVEWEGQTRSWLVADIRDLALTLNEALVPEGAQPIAILGEWRDALQLWTLPRQVLASLLRETEFLPENRAQLQGLIEIDVTLRNHKHS